jgi:multidrug efflux pump subunit AcrA (membrane-fusion protein)
MKRICCWALAFMMVFLMGGSLADTTYQGTVTSGNLLLVQAPFGGKVTDTRVQVGDLVSEGDTLVRISTTPVYAPIEGTITGLYITEGDKAESVTERYGASLFIEPVNRYVVKATPSKATGENKYIHLGEQVYLKSVTGGRHRGTGIISAMNGSDDASASAGTSDKEAKSEKGYSVEVIDGDFTMGEKVNVYRDPNYSKASNIGRGKVDRTKPLAVKGTGSVLLIHVSNGDYVERGQRLFETVEGVLDGLQASDSRVHSPAKGIISSVDKKDGENAAKGDTLMKIMPTSELRVEFEIPEADLFLLREGQRVSMELLWARETGVTYSGRITSISYVPTENKNTENKETKERKTYKAYASLEADERIRPGMTMMITVFSEEAAEPDDQAMVTETEITEPAAELQETETAETEPAEKHDDQYTVTETETTEPAAEPQATETAETEPAEKPAAETEDTALKTEESGSGTAMAALMAETAEADEPKVEHRDPTGGNELIFYEAPEGDPAENYGKGIRNVILTGNLIYIFRNAESETLTIHHIDTGDSETYSFDQMNERLSSLKTEAEEIPEEELKKAGLTRETRILQVSESTGVWFAWNGEIYNAVNREYMLEEGKAVSGGHVRKLKLNGGRADLEDEESVSLDWSRMKTADGGDKSVQASGSAGNRLYLSVTNDSDASELISFNLLSGESTEETPVGLDSFEVLGEDKLVICQVSSTESGQKNTYSLYNRETGSLEELMTLATDMEDPGDSAHYDEKNDLFYYSRNGEIFAVRNRNPEQAEGVNTDVLSSTRPFSMQLEDGRLMVWNRDGVFLRTTDPSLNQKTTIRIQSFAQNFSMDAALVRFASEHSDLSVAPENAGDESSVLQAMMNQDSRVDVYLMATDSSVFGSLYNRNFLKELDGSEKLTKAADRMYAFASESLSKDGKLVAVPLFVNALGIGYNGPALKKLNRTAADLPGTWEAFFACLEEEKEKLEGTDFRLFDLPLERRTLKEEILKNLLNQYSVLHPEEPYDVPLLQNLLDELNRIPYEKLGILTGEEIEQANADEEMYEAMGGLKTGLFNAGSPAAIWETPNIALPLALAAGEDPVLPVQLIVAFINPYSQHPQEAMTFLESALEQIDVFTSHSLYRDVTEPVRKSGYQAEKANMEKWLEISKKNEETAEDEGARAQWTETVKTMEKKLADLEDQSWLISPDAIAAYQSRVGFLKAPKGIFLQILMTSDSVDQFMEMMNGFMEGTRSASDLLGWIDRKIQMMRQEGN